MMCTLIDARVRPWEDTEKKKEINLHRGGTVDESGNTSRVV